MFYTAPEILLFIAAIGLVITNTITAWRTGVKLNSISEKAAVIEGHVNSKEAKYVEQLVSKDKEIELLKVVLIDKDKTAALLAQSLAMVPKVISVGDGQIIEERRRNATIKTETSK